MEWKEKNRYGIFHHVKMPKYGMEDLMHGMEQNLPCSVLAHFDMVLLKSGFSFSSTY